MKKLIDLFNKKYGSVYGVIDDSFSNEDTYKIYKIIKTLCSDDKEIMTVLEKVKLPEPKTAKESIEKININVKGGVGNDDVPHYKETLIFEISSEDYNNLINNQYFNMDALNIDETKSYISKNIDIVSNQEYVNELVYDRENDVLVNEINQIYIYNHKSYNGTNFVEDTNSAVITLGITPMSTEIKGYVYFRLYEVDKVELDNGCLSNDVSIKNSLTVGSRTGNIGECSVAEGSENTASGFTSHAEGICATASGDYSHAEGNTSTASGHNSHAEGVGAIASGVASHAEGMGSTASGEASCAEGSFTEASGGYSHAEGDSTTASGEASHAEGSGAIASGDYSHAEGSETTASGVASHAEGSFTKATDNTSHAEGNSTTALGDSSHIEGKSSNLATSVIQNLSSSTSNDDILTVWKTSQFSLAKGEASHVEGKDNLALGVSSHAEGEGTTASGDYSHAEGNNTSAGNSYCHSEGNSTKATGKTSHAEGSGTTASGNCSHSEGFKTNSIGRNSHAEGDSTTASGSSSHTEGTNTVSNGDNSHTEGLGTKAQGHQQHVQGKYNIVNTSYAHIVGNGASDTSRSNAHTLDWNGNAWYSGKLSQDGVPTEDKDLATKKYVDDKTALSTDVKNTLPSNGLLTLTTDKIQTTTLAVPTDITLPTVTGYTEIHLFFEGSEGVTITTGTTTVRWKTSPTISTGNLYEIVFTYINDTIGWIGDCLSYSA